MDDLQIIEIFDTLRERLAVDVPDLDQRLERVVLADYRTATREELQEALMQFAYNLDPANPNDAREILRRIALAESTAGNPGGRGNGARRPWSVHEPHHPELPPLDDGIARGIRYLALPPVEMDDGEPAGGDGPGARIVSIKPGVSEPPAGSTTVTRIPSRLGQQLAVARDPQAAVGVIKKHIPGLRRMQAWQFLGAIGYPVAVPGADALRFAARLGMIAADDTGPETAFLDVVDRAGRLTNVAVPRLGYLVSLYSGFAKLPDVKTVCGRRPFCDVCPLTSRCHYYATEYSQDRNGAEPGRSIKEWARDERPRERLLDGERLSNSELLGIILRTGSGRLSAVELGREIMNTFQTLHNLERATPQEIMARMKGKGIGEAKAAEICAALELGRRASAPAADTRLGLRQVSSSRDIFDICRARYKSKTQEEFLLLVLNIKNKIQKEIPVSLGTLNSSIVHPRDVFGHALREAAASVIFVHNHPSGDPAPSDEDIVLTSRLVDAGKLLGIKVLDHVIIGSHDYYSFADHGRIS